MGFDLTVLPFLAVWNDAEYEKHATAEATKPDKHYTFAEKLRDALRHSDTFCTESTDDSYAVDISISGSRTDADEGIRFVQMPLNMHEQYTKNSSKLLFLVW